MRATLLSTWGTLFVSLGVIAADSWPVSTFQTGPWQPPQLNINKTDGAEEGMIFIPIRNSNRAGTAVTIYDADGNFVYQGPEETTMDFKMQTLFGENVITYWSGEADQYAGYGYGQVHILDQTYKEIYTISLTGDFVTTNNETKDSYIDVHEHIITDRNTIIVSAANVTQYDLTAAGGQPDQWIVASQFYEIDVKTNKVLYSWNVLDQEAQIPLSESKMPIQSSVSQTSPWDCYHMNAVQATNEGFIVSFRHLWSAFYLNQNGTVRWQLSGANDGSGNFTGDDLRFSWQHHVRVYNETDESLVLSLFNNANSATDSESETTGMVFELDLLGHKGSMLYNLSDPADPIYTKTQGSFQFLGAAGTTANMFMGYGSACMLKEYSAQGDVVTSAEFGALGHAESYRAFKNQWIATPYWSPAVVTNGTGGSVNVYMSWNGATEYDNWQVYSVPSIDSNTTTKLANVARSGFETNAILNTSSVHYIKVAAQRGTSVLGWSDTVQL